MAPEQVRRRVETWTRTDTDNPLRLTFGSLESADAAQRLIAAGFPGLRSRLERLYTPPLLTSGGTFAVAVVVEMTG